MKHTNISIKEYERFCADSDYSPNYHPAFIEYYFSRLGKKINIIGVFDKHDNLIAAFPTILRQIFPNPLHARLLGDKFTKTCYIGQPESLIPISSQCNMIRLKHLSPTTSPILHGRIKSIVRYSLKSIAIAKADKHNKITQHQKKFFEDGGTVLFTDTLDSNIFADIYLKLHCERWGFCVDKLEFVRDQIKTLYNHVFGVVLFRHEEPIAAQLCYKSTSATLHYVDFINSGVKFEKKMSNGNVMFLTCLRRAENDAVIMGKKLRFSLGYYYGYKNYKAIWADPEPMYIAI